MWISILCYFPFIGVAEIILVIDRSSGSKTQFDAINIQIMLVMTFKKESVLIASYLFDNFVSRSKVPSVL